MLSMASNDILMAIAFNKGWRNHRVIICKNHRQKSPTEIIHQNCSLKLSIDGFCLVSVWRKFLSFCCQKDMSKTVIRNINS